MTDLGEKKSCDHGYHNVIVTLKKVKSNMEAILTSAIDKKCEPLHCSDGALNWTRFLLFQTPRSDIIKLAVRLAESEGLENLLASEIQQRLSHNDDAHDVLSNTQEKFEIIGGKPKDTASVDSR